MKLMREGVIPGELVVVKGSATTEEWTSKREGLQGKKLQGTKKRGAADLL